MLKVEQLLLRVSFEDVLLLVFENRFHNSAEHVDELHRHEALDVVLYCCDLVSQLLVCF